jgi:protein-L-isoaspartate(D-aspartate) O-methyltransferase
MTELAAVGPESAVLEIGTGSGYQAAILAEVVDHVYTMEISESLGARARETLERLGYENVSVRIGDGFQGWESAAPFDAIIVTAAPDHVPAPLLEQLAVGGRMVVPVGSEQGVQSLRLVEKFPGGQTRTSHVLPVRFVPMRRSR